MYSIGKKRLLKYILMSFLFTICYLIIIYWTYLIPNQIQDKISPFLILGYFIIIILIFMIFTTTRYDFSLKFRIISENKIRKILILLFLISLIIPSETFSKTIMDWHQVEFLNFIKAIFSLIAICFLPGAFLMDIFFYNLSIDKHLNVESFIVKLTLYPLFSIIFIGLITLVLDQIGLSSSNLFSLFMNFSILILYLISLQKKRKTRFTYMRDSIERKKFILLSKNTFYILLFAIGIICVSLGFLFNKEYLITGDAWDSISYANYIGISDGSIIGRARETLYPIFWGYITYGLSAISGLPFINTNVLLAPFCYLFITSLYLFIKSLLMNKDKKMIIFSLILILIFSSLFIIGSDYKPENITQFNIGSTFYFYYKGFSYYLLLILCTFFVILSKMNLKSFFRLPIKTKIRAIEFKISFLIAFFLVICYMIYVLPLLVGFFLIFIICWYNKEKLDKFRIFTFIILIFLIIFTIFDFLQNNFLSYFITNRIEYNILRSFFPIYIQQEFKYITYIVFGYYFLILFLVICYSLPSIGLKLYCKFIKNKKKEKLKKKNYFRVIYTTLLGIFYFLFFFYLFNFYLVEWFFSYLLEETNFAQYYIHKVISNMGFIGIIGISLSPVCYLKFRKLFKILLFWTLFFISLASIVIFIEWFKYPNLAPIEIPRDEFFLMNYWFDRIWFYSIIPLSMFTSIGIIYYSKKLRKKYLFLWKKRKNVLFSTKFILVFLLIFFSFSNLIITAFFYNNLNVNKTEGNEAQIMGWMSENIPKNSKVLIPRIYTLDHGIRKMALCDTYFIEDIISQITKDNKTDEELLNSFINKITQFNITYSVFHESYHYYFVYLDFVHNYLDLYFYNLTIYLYQGYNINFNPNM